MDEEGDEQSRCGAAVCRVTYNQCVPCYIPHSVNEPRTTRRRRRLTPPPRHLTSQHLAFPQSPRPSSACSPASPDVSACVRSCSVSHVLPWLSMLRLEWSRMATEAMATEAGLGSNTPLADTGAVHHGVAGVRMLVKKWARGVCVGGGCTGDPGARGFVLPPSLSYPATLGPPPPPPESARDFA